MDIKFSTVHELKDALHSKQISSTEITKAYVQNLALAYAGIFLAVLGSLTGGAYYYNDMLNTEKTALDREIRVLEERIEAAQRVEVKEEEIDDFANLLFNEYFRKNNPRPIDLDIMKKFVKAMYDGNYNEKI